MSVLACFTLLQLNYGIQEQLACRSFSLFHILRYSYRITRTQCSTIFWWDLLVVTALCEQSLAHFSRMYLLQIFVYIESVVFSCKVIVLRYENTDRPTPNLASRYELPVQSFCDDFQFMYVLFVQHFLFFNFLNFASSCRNQILELTA